MTLEEIVRRIPQFTSWSHADKIRFFAWYENSVRGRPTFSTADITKRFDELHLQRPSNVSQFVRQLLEQGQVLKNGAGFRLAKTQRDQMDARYLDRDETIEIDQLLRELPTRLPGLAEQTYLNEALICFRHKAFRAAVVMTWNVGYDRLLHTILTTKLAAFNNQLAGMFGGKKKTVASRDDFQRLRESEVIEVCIAAALVSKEVGKVLTDKLDKRNSAAHPSGTVCDKLQTEAFISDLMNNAILRLV